MRKSELCTKSCNGRAMRAWLLQSASLTAPSKREPFYQIIFRLSNKLRRTRRDAHCASAFCAEFAFCSIIVIASTEADVWKRKSKGGTFQVLKARTGRNARLFLYVLLKNATQISPDWQILLTCGSIKCKIEIVRVKACADLCCAGHCAGEKRGAFRPTFPGVWYIKTE